MKLNKTFLGLALAASSLSIYACDSKDDLDIASDEPIDETFAVQTEKMLINVDTLYSDLESPWGMTWLPDGKMLLTERKGEILIFENDKFTGQKVQGLPKVHEVNQAGLLDVQAHPNYAQNGWIYISYAKPKGGNKGATTIMRFKLEGNQAVQQEELIETTPEWEGGRHYGSRIVFDKDNYLFFSNGDRGDTPSNAQDLTNSHGKIHRIHDDGRIPSDNPFVNEPNAIKSIWTYGNRNPQGLVYDKANDRVWEAEHGPMGGDELNLIEKGKNYGWPVITYGQNYDGTPITDITEKEGMEQPVTYYVPSIATCGMTIVTSDKYPAWKGDILIGALAKMHINRVDMDGTKALSQEVMLQDIGRVRQVSESPDGYLYAITEGTGLLVKLIPIR
ncbi:Glucose/arabinose dehydrogenase, beta-propeller fold [Algoriphagus ornithinivorans]|uniref:Glucose/arabinose dehydrogenase, beta-propeller fold n=2 Tax=Algoriphagus TaxID=246875 RepID=A0A1I5JHH7_9BACT|nr:PQQ-dependent sugar dehydrogenase [Algoriphagus ornithinivorans]SFO72278.1 Glucose/arabinose dehydrogenase, beta-propeller fold [Algoriphagus ornithinivorans]